MPQIAYETVDVFTTNRFTGNPLAVIPDARGLEEGDMQRIAAEFGYSETTFVLPPADHQHTARVRIFTPTLEMPFAGHPNVGTAYVLARRGSAFGRPIGDRMQFEERAGLVGVSVLRAEDHVSGAAITAPRALEVGQEIPVDVVAACVSLTGEEIRVTAHQPRVVSVGAPFVVAELASRNALAQTKPDLARFAEAAAAFPMPEGGFALFLYTPTLGAPERLSTRMYAHSGRVDEDPATGSAAAALAAYLVALMPEADLDVALTFEQGVDMGRPSELSLHIHKVGGIVEEVVVSGNCVTVMQGDLQL